MPVRRNILIRNWDLVVEELILAMELCKACLLVGPTGCGKTSCALRAAEALGRPSEVFHMGGVYDAEAFLDGTLQLREGGTLFVPSRFARALVKPYTVIVLDELNRTSPKLQNGLLPLLDFQRSKASSLSAPEDAVSHCAEGLSFIATANVGAEFVGAQPLDAALENRLRILRLDYPDCELDLLRAEGLGRGDARKLMNAARNIRAQYGKGALSATISTRGLTDAAAIMASGRDLEWALMCSVPVYHEAEVSALLTTVRGGK